MGTWQSGGPARPTLTWAEPVTGDPTLSLRRSPVGANTFHF